jgi:hypothetical protein
MIIEDLAGRFMQLAEPIPIDKFPAGTYWGTVSGPLATKYWGGR